MVAEPVPRGLRALLDAADSYGRYAAARWLAVLGAQEDEGRIAHAMVEMGGWIPTRPQGRAPRTPMEELLGALVPESVVDHCDSDFDPLLEIGFGPQGAARVRAKAYAVIARRHADAGRLPFARRSMEHAASLDPMNLDVARLRRTL